MFTTDLGTGNMKLTTGVHDRFEADRRNTFSDIWRLRHSASPDGGTRGNPVGVAIRSREDHSDEKITHHEVGWSPVRNHSINVRGGQVSDWEESQMLAALAVSELPAALQ
jgi:hypothetical protein